MELLFWKIARPDDLISNPCVIKKSKSLKGSIKFRKNLKLSCIYFIVFQFLSSVKGIGDHPEIT